MIYDLKANQSEGLSYDFACFIASIICFLSYGLFTVL